MENVHEKNVNKIIDLFGNYQALILLSTIIDNWVIHHPLPWKKNQDWTLSIQDANGKEIIHDCHSTEFADKVITIANQRKNQMEKDAGQLEIELEMEPGSFTGKTD